ncbi:MAG: gliding motility-associated C-terminal domain-containing protein, partial [Cytophagaceae bacterium]|nr:gliding motility-associated C-terminal domain-containing protein [Cytophagaceae bacterium]
ATPAATTTYTVTVTDGNGCQDTDDVTVFVNPAPTGIATANPNPVCLGDATLVTANFDAGFIPAANAYSFDGGNSFQAGNTFNIPAVNSDTTVLVVLTDANGCVSSPITVSIRMRDFIVSLTNTSPLCNGNNDGIIDITNVAGGTGPYNLSLNGMPGVAPFTYNNLIAGVYNLTVVDAIGCRYDTSITITEPTDLSLSGISNSPICAFGNNGQITLFGMGGSPGYLFADSNMNFGATNIFTGLNAGTFRFYVRDSNFCLDSADVTLNSFPPVNINTMGVVVKHLTCNGVNTGEIHLSNISGGIRPLTFSLNGGTAQSDSNFVSLAAATHTITITDANNCSFIYDTTITSPPAISFNLTPTKLETCNNGDGEFILDNVSGGMSPYTYSFNNGARVAYPGGVVTFDSLTSGVYTIEVFDSSLPPFGCSTTRSLTLPKKPGPVPFVKVVDAKCYKGNDGEISIDSLEGGAPLFKRIILNKIIINPDSSITVAQIDSALNVGSNTVITFPGLNKASYFMTIEDQECVYPINFFYEYQAWDSVLNQPDYDTIMPVLNVNHPDSITALISTFASDRYLSVGYAFIHNITGGTPGYEWSMDSTTFLPIANDSVTIYNLATGSYVVYIRDNNGCKYKFTFSIGAGFYIPNLITPNSDGHNDVFEVIGLPPGSEVRIYNRWGSRVYFNKNYDNSWDGSNEPAGVYYYDLVLPNNKLYKGWVEIVR